jgi:hypothetical protein
MCKGNKHGNTLGVDGSQISVLKERHKVGLSGLLESHDGRGLETQVGLTMGEFHIASDM